MSDQVTIRSDRLLPPYHLLRPVNKESLEFWELRDSIRRFGILKPLLVRPSPGRPGFFEVVDGWCRFNAGCAIALEAYPCHVKHLDDGEVLIAQLQANACTIQPTRLEYARHIRKVMRAKPIGLTALAGKLGKSPKWVRDTLGLLSLCAEALTQLEAGRLFVLNSLLLSKLRVEDQRRYLSEAIALGNDEFAKLVLPIIRDKRRPPRSDEFHFKAHLRTLDEIARELGMSEIGHDAVQDCKTPLDGFYAGLKWCVHSDDNSIAELRQKFEARKAGKTRKDEHAKELNP